MDDDPAGVDDLDEAGACGTGQRRQSLDHVVRKLRVRADRLACSQAVAFLDHALPRSGEEGVRLGRRVHAAPDDRKHGLDAGRSRTLVGHGCQIVAPDGDPAPAAGNR